MSESPDSPCLSWGGGMVSLTVHAACQLSLVAFAVRSGTRTAVARTAWSIGPLKIPVIAST